MKALPPGHLLIQRSMRASLMDGGCGARWEFVFFWDSFKTFILTQIVFARFCEFIIDKR